MLSLITLLLLATTTLSPLIAAHPQPLQTRQPDVEPLGGQPDINILQTLSLPLKIGKEPSGSAECPASNNGANRDYHAHKYTENQIKAAFIEGAKLAAAGKEIGEQKYPHTFGNGERLPFECGKEKKEFPIQLDGKVYEGGDVRGVPDRVVFEYAEEKKGGEKVALVKYCGVMRHGPGRDFLRC